MKITDYIIIFIIIYLPVFFYIQINTEKTTDFEEMNHHNKQALNTAVQDSVEILRTNIQPHLEVGYNSYKINPANPQLAYDAFLRTLAINYKVVDKNTLSVLENYIPLFSVVDYDGLLLSVYKEYTDSSNQSNYERVWLPKIPFSYSDDEGNVINFTVDDYVEVYDSELNEWISDKRSVLANDTDITVPLLLDEANFEQVRRTTIVNTLQENFAYYINEHNVYRKGLGITYKFTLPVISQEDWYNTIDDVGVFAFFQGYPYLLNNVQFNEFAFAGSRLERAERIFAGTVDNQKRYWNESCNYNYQADEIYSREKDAAANGYSELSCLNPGIK